MSRRNSRSRPPVLSIRRRRPPPGCDTTPQHQVLPRIRRGNGKGTPPRRFAAMRALIWVPKSCRKLEPHRISPTQLARSSKHRRRRNIYSSTFFLRHMSRSAVESPEQIPDDDDVYFHVIDGVEEMGRYRPGGYHPVSIGDRLHDRYRVVHKLGYGSYSTAWLARDEQLQRLVAVKVCTADANQRESKILSLLGKSPSRSSNDSFMSGQDVIPLLLDTFRLHGPNGTHTCNVTEFTKGNLAEAKRKSWNMPMPLQVARAMAAQFVLAAAYMHHKGYVHGGASNSSSSFPIQVLLSDMPCSRPPHR